MSTEKKKPIGRREALIRLGGAVGVLGAATGVGLAINDKGGFGVEKPGTDAQVRDYRLKERPDPGLAELAIARGEVVDDEEPKAEDLVRRAVDAMGGMKKFVSRGDVVAIKPNIGWNRMPIHAANTNPEVVAAVIRLAFDAGAKKVIVADGSCNEPALCYRNSGIEAASRPLGAEVIHPLEHRFRSMRLKGDVLDEWPVFTTLIEADKVISVPVAKHHNLAKYTAAMKNWYGCLGGRRNRLHQSIDRSIADLANFMRPTLVVVDAMRVLMRNGPQGGNVDDAKEMYTIIATVDQVAADAYGCTLIGQSRENLPYLEKGMKYGLGTMYYENLRVRAV